MKTINNKLLIAFLSLVIGVTTRCALAIEKQETQHLDKTEIDEQVFIPAATTGGTARLYLVLTVSNDVRTCQAIVFRHAKEALAAVSKYGQIDINAVFFIRATKDSDTGSVSGFSSSQLKELIAMPDDKARKEVCMHAWSLEVIPKSGRNKAPEPTR